MNKEMDFGARVLQMQVNSATDCHDNNNNNENNDPLLHIEACIYTCELPLPRLIS